MLQQIIDLNLIIERAIFFLLIGAFALIVYAIFLQVRKRNKVNKKNELVNPKEIQTTSSLSDENLNIIPELELSKKQAEDVVNIEDLRRLKTKTPHLTNENIHEIVESKITSDSNLKTIEYNPVNLFPTEESNTFPYVIMPQLDCVIKPAKLGKLGRKGLKEEQFKSYLISYFSNYCIICDNHYLSVRNEGTVYEPDITLIKENKNIYVDIEIDEPYEGTNDIVNRRPTHYHRSDSIRNFDFQIRGWIVIRFAEIQIDQSPLSCCRFIANVFSSIDVDYKIPNSLLKVNNVEPVDIWSRLKAECMSLERVREKYLEIDSFGITESSSFGGTFEVTKTDSLIEKRISETLYSQTTNFY